MNNIKNFFSDLIDSKTKKKIPLLIAMFFFSSLINIIGLWLVGTFLLAITKGNSLSTNSPFHIEFISLTSFESIAIISIMLVLSFIFKSYWTIFSIKKLHKISNEFSTKLKFRLINAYQNASYEYYFVQPIQNISTQLSWIDIFTNNILLNLLKMSSSVLYLFMMLSLLFYLHPIITFILLICLVAIFIAYNIYFKPKFTRFGRSMYLSANQINKNSLNALFGFRDIKIFNKEGNYSSLIKENMDIYTTAGSMYNTLKQIPRSIIECLSGIFLVIAIVVLSMFNQNPISMLPMLGVFTAAILRIFPIINNILTQVSDYHNGIYACKKLHSLLLDLEKKYYFPISRHTNKIGFKSIALHNVSYEYPTLNIPAIKNISLQIFRGDCVGIIGKSGAGKSTLVNILIGLLIPSSGHLLIDGKPIHDYRSWLNNLSYIPQSIFLKNDTIKNNIALGIEGELHDAKLLEHVIKTAQLQELISTLPNGIDTVIGENGITLSGGQCQRIALARALYFDREVIIMDEATSSLDFDTEREIFKAIKEISNYKTVIIIAHRLSTLKSCKRIFHIDSGHLIYQTDDHSKIKKIIEANTVEIV